MKNLKSKIFAGVIATSLCLGEKNSIAQSAKEMSKIYPDSLCIEMIGFDNGKIDQRINSSGYYNGKWVIFIGCNNFKENHYSKRVINWGIQNNLNEEFIIKYDSGTIDYRIYLDNQNKEIVNFKNLTREQIFQDKEFAERTKKIINACESEENLREVLKELYKENGRVYIPRIK